MTDSSPLLIRNGRLIDPLQEIDTITDLLLADGKIQAMGPIDTPDHCTVIDASGLIVAPGLIDMHVHFREPGFEYKETIAGGSLAAAAGGVTSVATMPNTHPTVDDPSMAAFVLERGRLAGRCHVYPIGAITRGLKGEELTEIGLLQQAGCVGFSDDGKVVMDSGLMRRALDYSRTFGALVIQHAEDCGLARGGCMHEGLTSSRLGLPGIPAAAEETIIDRDIRLVTLTGGRYHVAHISTAGAVAAVARAQAEGLAVSCEVTPHHFTLIDTDVGEYNTNAKMAPPLRSAADRQAVRDGLARGIIAVIATDHAPHELDSKNTSFREASNGVVGLETMLPVALDLVREGVLTLPRCLAAMTCNPARLLGIPGGTLAVGAPADVVIFNADERWLVTPDTLHGTSRNSSFLGRTVTGRVKMTLLSGKVVYRDGD